MLLAGDAAGLVNPLTGEGIFYAVATGLLAGSTAAESLRTGRSPAAAYQRDIRALLGGHLRHTALAARLTRDQVVFDDLVELGLARGRLTARVLLGLGRQLAGVGRPSPTPATIEHVPSNSPSGWPSVKELS